MEIFPVLIAFGVATLTLLAVSAKTTNEKKFDRFLATIQISLEIVVILIAIGLATIVGGPLGIIFWLIVAIMSFAMILGLGILILRVIFP